MTYGPMRRTAAASMLVLTAALSACTTGVNPNRYDAYSVGVVQRTERGEVQSYRYVEIDTGRGGATGVGVASGAIAGSTVGHGAEGVLGAIGGAILGGLIGSAIDNDVGRRDGFEYVIRTEGGYLVTIVQADRIPFPEGAPVLIMHGSNMTRVTLDESRIAYGRDPDDPNGPSVDDGPAY